MQGITIRSYIGIGDALQFSSLPENYFRAKGEKLVDISKPWFFDHNPFVVRDAAYVKATELWNFGPKQWEFPRPHMQGVYTCNAEIPASLFGVGVTLNRPRLYKFEEFPFHERRTILIQTNGRSHGAMPDHVVQHVLKKYAPTGNLYQIGLDDAMQLGIPKLKTPTLWALASAIAQARMLICLDSGPAWIAACYPDVVVKKLRTRPNPPDFKTWVPLAVDNIHSHWDDRCHQIFNPTETDIGFTTSYRKI